MNDLDILDAEAIGIDGMDIVKAIPDVLKGAGQALSPKADLTPAAPPPPPPPPEGLSTGWKVGIGAAVVGGLLLLLKR